MPKLKTNKAAKKRFKMSKSGTIKRYRSGRRHLFTGKSRKRLRQLGLRGSVGAPDHREIARLLPYG